MGSGVESGVSGGRGRKILAGTPFPWGKEIPGAPKNRSPTGSLLQRNSLHPE